jgi:hypothetical protein
MDVNSQLHAPAALFLDPRYPLDGPQNWFGRSGIAEHLCVYRELYPSLCHRKIITESPLVPSFIKIRWAVFKLKHAEGQKTRHVVVPFTALGAL